VDAQGKFTDAIPWLSGMHVREANTTINDELERRGSLFKRMDYLHALPHCWRCKSILIYWGKPSWYIATSQIATQMVAENEGIDWHPAHIRDGRFGEWLSNNVDWALSRDRFWGTPLPIWRCDEGHLVCVSSRAELSELAGRDVSGIDPHRPAIDAVTISCAECEGSGLLSTMYRVAPVIDAWFDSGSMPAAQVGYPATPGSKNRFSFPADFITEAIDQTRGWFYSLLAVNTLVFGEAPYKHVMCLGHIIDADGKKMSKSQGNIIEPHEILDSLGADALRWWMYSQGSPWTPTRVSIPAIESAMGETLSTLWNTYSFFVTYASLNGFEPSDPAIPTEAQRSDLDRWVLSRMNATLKEVTLQLEDYEPLHAAVPIAKLVDDLSNWYVRRSRRRFWRTDPSMPASDALAAQATLHEVLVRISEMLAPLCPFLADELWCNLTGAKPEDSIHLANWPSANTGLIDAELEASMDVARRLTSIGRAARAEAGVKVRQPLRRALVFLPPGAAIPPAGIVEDELNVDSLEFMEETSGVLRFELVPNFKTLGPRLGEDVKHVRAALVTADAAHLASLLEAGSPIALAIEGRSIELGTDDVELRVKAAEGFAVSREGGEVVALDLGLDEDLIRRGVVRDVIRQIQDLRKSTGLALQDRIAITLHGLETLGEEDLSTIGVEVLGVSVVRGIGTGEAHTLELDTETASVWISRV
jgi:isoleucyl-tRNA synthetase